jgi:hypothetical protein
LGCLVSRATGCAEYRCGQKESQTENVVGVATVAPSRVAFKAKTSLDDAKRRRRAPLAAAGSPRAVKHSRMAKKMVCVSLSNHEEYSS